MLGGAATATTAAVMPVGGSAPMAGAQLALKTAVASTAVSAPGFAYSKSASTLALAGAVGQISVSVTLTGALEAAAPLHCLTSLSHQGLATSLCTCRPCGTAQRYFMS